MEHTGKKPDRAPWEAAAVGGNNRVDENCFDTRRRRMRLGSIGYGLVGDTNKNTTTANGMTMIVRRIADCSVFIRHRIHQIVSQLSHCKIRLAEGAKVLSVLPDI